jgi:hypothetical protein
MAWAALILSAIAILIAGIAAGYSRRQAQAAEDAAVTADKQLQLDRERLTREFADRLPKLWVEKAANIGSGGDDATWSGTARVHNDGGSHAPQVVVEVRLHKEGEVSQIGGSRVPQDVPRGNPVDFAVHVYNASMWGGSGGIEQGIAEGRIVLHAYDALGNQSVDAQPTTARLK